MDVGKNIMQPEGYKALIPQEFPPREGLTFSREIEHKNEEAMRLLGKLDGSTKLLPDQDFFLFMHIRKDAASSSQIEGTRATMIDALEAEAELDTDLPEDVDDILHYINALNYGLERLNEFPLSLRLIRELHAELMRGARGNANTRAGEFRKSQNWIGGTGPQNAHFVPPP
ncbi:MAG: cell filamentation protein Fic, partial [Parcubacteria group bacterium SW_4_46_8]